VKVLATLLVLPMLLVSVAAADLSGVWTLALNPDLGGEPDSFDCTFKQDGRKLTITCRTAPPFSGEVNDQRVTWHVTTGRNGEITATFDGALDRRATTITGMWRFTDQGVKHEGKFEAKQQ
jgi:hypothetical protein